MQVITQVITRDDEQSEHQQLFLNPQRTEATGKTASPKSGETGASGEIPPKLVYLEPKHWKPNVVKPLPLLGILTNSCRLTSLIMTNSWGLQSKDSSHTFLGFPPWNPIGAQSQVQEKSPVALIREGEAASVTLAVPSL